MLTRYCKPRKNNVPLIITNLTSAVKSLKFVDVNVQSCAHAHIFHVFSRVHILPVCLFIVGWSVLAVSKAPTCRMQRGEVSPRRQTKQFCVSWSTVTKGSGYEVSITTTRQKYVPRLPSMHARVVTKRPSRSTRWNSAILFHKAR